MGERRGILMRAVRWAATFKAGVVLSAVNVIGAALYLRFASFAWRDPQEKALGIPLAGGDVMIWGLTAFPILVFFALMAVVWGIWLIRKRDTRQTRFWTSTMAMWIVVLWFDSVHS